MSAEKEKKITNSSKDEKEEHKVKCIDCINLVQSQHYLSQEILGHHCFSIERGQEYPDQYNFDVLQVKKERTCKWFKSQADFITESAEHDEPLPKIQRSVVIMVRWGYNRKAYESPEDMDL